MIPSGTALDPVEEYGDPAVSLGLTLQQSGSFVSGACLEALDQGQVWLVPLEASQSLDSWTINSSCFRVFLRTPGLIIRWFI